MAIQKKKNKEEIGKMKGCYFDWQIFGCERLTKEERRLRERLQCERTAREALSGLDARQGLRRDVREVRTRLSVR